MKDRLKQIRKHYDITQTEFGNRIGATRTIVTSWEIGKVIPSDMAINAIVREFGVDPIWLRTGMGDMFDDETDEIATKVDLLLAGENEMAKALFKAFAKLDKNDWMVIKKIIDSLSEESKDESS